MQCTGGQIYKQCLPSEPSTCDLSSNKFFTDFCVEGCDCPGDSVLYNGRCISPQSCPCTHNNVTYMSGEDVRSDCNIW